MEAVGGSAEINADMKLDGTVRVDVGDTGAVLTIAGNLSDLYGENPGGILKTGNGQLVLSGNNSYTGTTTVHQGAVDVLSTNALGSTEAGTTVADGATLQLQGNVTTAAEPLTLNGIGVEDAFSPVWYYGALQTVSGSNTYSGPITLGSNVQISSSDPSIISGALTLSSTADCHYAGAGLRPDDWRWQRNDR